MPLVREQKKSKTKKSKKLESYKEEKKPHEKLRAIHRLLPSLWRKNDQKIQTKKEKKKRARCNN